MLFSRLLTAIACRITAKRPLVLAARTSFWTGET
jgi:hypothetical protein